MISKLKMIPEINNYLGVIILILEIRDSYNVFIKNLDNYTASMCIITNEYLK